jgi:hypothetical protein
VFSKKNILQEIDMDFLVGFSIETRLLKSRKYFTKRDFVLGLSKALSSEECEFVYEKYKQGLPFKTVSNSFLLTKSPTAKIITNNLIRHLALKYTQILNNIVFKELNVGKFRTDVNQINGVSYTYEVKTGRDKIEKSILQTAEFSKVFEYVYLVTRNEESIPSKLNENVGVLLAEFDDGHLIFDEVTTPIKNTLLSGRLQLQTFRKDELISFYGEDGKTKSREELLESLLATETEENINRKFKLVLKERFRPQWYEYVRKNFS